MKNPLISIIIPMHNAGAFIVECLESVLAQTYRNLEVIVVDDNSTDGSTEIAKSYAGKYDNFTYVRVENGNAAKTRRDGLVKSTADLVCFADADDVLDKRYVEHLYRTLEVTNTKMAACSIQAFEGVLEPARQVASRRGAYTIESSASAFADHYHITDKNKLTLQTLPCKIFAKDLFDDIDYAALRANIFEDNFIMAQILAKVKKIGVIDEVLYWYRQSSSSTSGSVLMTTVQYEGKDLNSVEYFRDVVMDYCRKKLPGPDVDAAIDRLGAKEFFHHARTVPDLVVRTAYLEQKLELENKRLLDREARIKDKNMQLKEKDEQLQVILNSRPYRIGLKIAKPIGRVMSILNRGRV